jgi:hypothetical protein
MLGKIPLGVQLEAEEMREGFVPRTTGALVLAVLLGASFILTLMPAQAQSQGNPPSVECASDDPAWNGRYLKIQVNDGVLTNETEGDGQINLDGTTGIVNWTNEDTDVVFRVVLKAGQGVGSDLVTAGWWVPSDGGTIDVDYVGLSHVTWCFADPDDETTTTTEATTTTTEATTTSTEATTTSTEATTTTTEQETTTTDVSVLAVQITTSSVSAETLPFTGAGFGEGGAVGVALAMLALGGVALLTVRRREEDAVTVATGWSSRLWDVE